MFRHGKFCIAITCTVYTVVTAVLLHFSIFRPHPGKSSPWERAALPLSALCSSTSRHFVASALFRPSRETLAHNGARRRGGGGGGGELSSLGHRPLLLPLPHTSSSSTYVCVCVCVRERERERVSAWKRGRGRGAMHLYRIHHCCSEFVNKKGKRRRSRHRFFLL